MVDTLCRAISVTIDSDLFFGYFAVVHPNTVTYPEPFWLEVPKIVALKKHEWKSFDETKIRDQRRRITKGCAVYLTLSLLSFGRSLIVLPLGDRTLIVFFLVSAGWATNVPCEETKGNRLPLPFMGKVPKAYPSYSDILSAQLGGESFSSVNASEKTMVGLRIHRMMKQSLRRTVLQRKSLLTALLMIARPKRRRRRRKINLLRRLRLALKKEKMSPTRTAEERTVRLKR